MPAARNYIVDGRRTSLRLEDEFASALQDITAREATLPGLLIADAVRARPELGRTSATRAYILHFYRERDTLDAMGPLRRVSGASAPLAANPAAGAAA